jgi:SAM-dependent methyltransferase
MTKKWYHEFFEGPMVEFWQRVVPAEQTAAEIGGMLALLSLPECGRVLDMPCGCGRHALELAACGYQVHGVDISQVSIARARQQARQRNLSIEFTIGDMECFVAEAPYDAAICLGNSFGYLEHAANERFLRGVASSLKPGCRFLLDCSAVAESLLPNYEEAFAIPAGDMTMEIENRYDAEQSRLHTRFSFLQNGERQTFPGSQAIYTSGEVGRLLEHAGLHVLARFSALDGTSYHLKDQRLYLLAERR